MSQTIAAGDEISIDLAKGVVSHSGSAIRALAICAALLMATSVAHSDPTPVPKADVKKAISYIRHAWGSTAPCPDVARCATYFSSFGTALTFSDGTMVPLAHEQRLNKSGHECIQTAHAALHGGNRALAVQWVMAAHLYDPLARNWLADHPDAVLEGLHHFGG